MMIPKNWMMMMNQIKIPQKLAPLFSEPFGSLRFRCAYGGRGSGKSRTFALMTAIQAFMFDSQKKEGSILCGREFQNSLSESSMEEIKTAIRSIPWLLPFFDLGQKSVKTKSGRIKFIFSGLRRNIDSLKSKSQILLCWIDEAETVSEEAYRVLLPTIREKNSEIWISWNPQLEGSPTDTRFRLNKPENCKTVSINYTDNPWFPDSLENQRQIDQRNLDPATYSWIWEGAYLKNTEAVIFKDKVIVEPIRVFDSYFGPFYGLDYGFSQDPLACVEVWLWADYIFITKEFGGVGIELDEIAKLAREKMPGIEQHTIRADNARPESTSFIQKHGLPRIRSVEKWPGSVKDGISWLRGKKSIIVDPSCKKIIEEFRLYSYKVDRLSGDIRPEIVDAHNHYIDALRYALQIYIKVENTIDYKKLSTL